VALAEPRSLDTSLAGIAFAADGAATALWTTWTGSRTVIEASERR
jgi:hypothetical protein